jgi:ubiquinone biosynthesis protein UbiJ
MTNSEIRDLLSRLRDEMQRSQLDTETRNLMRELDSDIHKLLDPKEGDVESTSVLERAREFETSLESDHPTAVRILSEVIETLSRMGI